MTHEQSFVPLYRNTMKTRQALFHTSTYWYLSLLCSHRKALVRCQLLPIHKAAANNNTSTGNKYCQGMKMGLKTVATYGLGNATAGTRTPCLNIAQGSVLDFFVAEDEKETKSAKPRVGAIVNAANEGCLYGGGVDGAINEAGGPGLWMDRKALPVLEGTGDIRCRTGGAVVTGPNRYGTLRVPYVVHAVGPAYVRFEGDDYSQPDALLRLAYQESLKRCQEEGITDVAFSLLSAGIFRGNRSLHDVLTIAVMAIRDWVDAEKEPAMDVTAIADTADADTATTDATADADANADADGEDIDKDEVSSYPHRLESITLCGFSKREITVLTEVCRIIFEKNDDDKEEKDAEKEENGAEAKEEQKETAVDNMEVCEETAVDSMEEQKETATNNPAKE
mmetsp:Transcript_4844/g.11140  ORF Transcript_4844/g.11140 Transcript_4844/m.11140 type:complete len:394 (-) Transcript_4844:1543-2724(-)